jgi:hypothetical protein
MKLLNDFIDKMAEGVGFEPTEGVNLQRFSRPPP